MPPATTAAASSTALSGPPSSRVRPILGGNWTDFSSRDRTDVRAIVHAAAGWCRSYREAAVFIQSGLERRFGVLLGPWCVAVGRGLVLNARSRRGARALLRVPCLACELPSPGAAPSEDLAFSVLCFQPVSDADAVGGLASAPHLVGGDAGAALATAGNGSRGPALPAGVLASAAPDTPGGRRVVELAGGVLARCGLHAGSDVAFAAALKTALSDEWGSTWHVILSGAAPPTLAALGGRAKAPTPVYGAAHLTGIPPLLCVPGSFVELALAAGHPTQAPPVPASLAGAAALVAGAGGAGEVAAAPLPPAGGADAGDAPAAAPLKLRGVSAPLPARTPAQYHAVVYQTRVTADEGSSLAAWALLHLRQAWGQRPLTVLRVGAYAAAFACFMAFTSLLYVSNNACSRLALQGDHSGAASSVVASAAAPMGHFFAALGVAVPWAAAPTPSAALPPWWDDLALPQELAHSGSGASRSWSTTASAVAAHASHALDLWVPSPSRNEAALERSLPRLAPEALTPSAPDAPPAPRFSALELGLPAACTRAQVLLADVRVARGRALIVATLVLVVAAALLLRSAEKVLERVRMARVMRALRELARPAEGVGERGEKSSKKTR